MIGSLEKSREEKRSSHSWADHRVCRDFPGGNEWKGERKEKPWLVKAEVSGQNRLVEGNGLEKRRSSNLWCRLLHHSPAMVGDGFIYSSTGWEIASFFFRPRAHAGIRLISYLTFEHFLSVRTNPLG